MHTQERALLMRLITPQRLKDNEAFMWRLADEQLDEFVADGRCEFISVYAQPFAMLVVADLLGVPEADHQRFREGFGLSAAPGGVGAGPQATRAQPARMARRLVRDLHRGPAARAAQGRVDRPRPRDVPGRHHARRHQRRAHRHLLVRRRPGDDGAPARGRVAASSPSTPSSRTSSGRTTNASRASSRKCCAWRAR